MPGANALIFEMVLKWWDCWTSVDFRSKLEISTAMRGPVLLGASLERRCGETMTKPSHVQNLCNAGKWRSVGRTVS